MLPLTIILVGCSKVQPTEHTDRNEKINKVYTSEKVAPVNTDVETIGIKPSEYNYSRPIYK